MNANITETAMKIIGVNTVPEHDPYHRGQGVPTSTILAINPTRREVSVGQEMDQGATPMDEWHGRILTFDLGTAEEYADYSSRTPNGQALMDYLSGETAQRLLALICDEYDIYFDGSNMVGRHTEESQTATETLLNGIAALPHTKYFLWQAGDWLQAVDVSADTTDEAIDEWADDGCEYDGGIIVLDEDAGVYLRRIRDEMREDDE